jgi:quinoprotein glucose dehydrogenase
MRRTVLAGAATGLVTCLAVAGMAQAAGGAGWGSYGGDAGGQRYSPAAQVTPANVGRLAEAWRAPIDSAVAVGAAAMKRSAFENTPILAEAALCLFALQSGRGAGSGHWPPALALRPAPRRDHPLSQ